jgi:hypothetical protein
MIQNVYLIVEPGADRVYVSGSYPDSFVRTKPGTRVFLAHVELPGAEVVDGKIALTGQEITMQKLAEQRE